MINAYVILPNFQFKFITIYVTWFLLSLFQDICKKTEKILPSLLVHSIEFFTNVHLFYNDLKCIEHYFNLTLYMCT